MIFDFSPHLRTLREQFNADQKKLDAIADAGGIKPSYLYKLLRSEFQPSREILTRWCGATVVLPQWFRTECCNADPDGAGPIRSNPLAPAADFKKLDADGDRKLTLADARIHGNLAIRDIAHAATELDHAYADGYLDADDLALQAKLNGDCQERLNCQRAVLAHLAHS